MNRHTIDTKVAIWLNRATFYKFNRFIHDWYLKRYPHSYCNYPHGPSCETWQDRYDAGEHPFPEIEQYALEDQNTAELDAYEALVNALDNFGRTQR